MLETLAVVWTARLAVFCYLASLLFQTASRKPNLARALWTAGFVIFAIHLSAAFQFVHNWSHTDAWNHTAEQTEKLTGWNWGGGIWFNYLFALLWGYDVLQSFQSNSRNWKGVWLIHSYLGFIVLNATVVFGIWWWKLVAALYIPILIVLGRRRTPPKTESPV
ncbi:MAG TPA: hypothetical protein VMM56_06820 [Planctomycetaceae bacterium]|nr:hypothetical protein [Planctomycetaceae bacterium]